MLEIYKIILCFYEQFQYSFYSFLKDRFVSGCGLTKDSLKNIPREILHKIEPEYCGVCALELDSFGMCKSMTGIYVNL